MSTTFESICKAALRRGGIAQLANIGPSSDQLAELVADANRLLSSWNLHGYVYNSRIDRAPMDPPQTSYFWGPTGDFVYPRPVHIVAARVIVMSTSPETAHPLEIIRTADEWARICMQELPGPWPTAIFPEMLMPDMKIHLYPYPTMVNDLELTYWDELPASIVDGATVIDLPHGYEKALVTELAIAARQMDPALSRLNEAQYAALLNERSREQRDIVAINTHSRPFRHEMGGGAQDPEALFLRGQR